MPNVNYAENEDLHELGRAVIADEYPFLDDLGVEIRFRLSKKEANIEADNFWGETRLFTNERAYEAQLADIKTAKIMPPSFVCIDCMRWQPNKQATKRTIGIVEYVFCVACQSKLTDDQLQSPDDKTIAMFARRQKRVDRIQSAGPPEYDGFFGIYMNEAEWNNADEPTRRARLSAQIARCGADKNDKDELKLRLIVPPIKLFPGVVAVHGTDWWKRAKELETIMLTPRQLSLEMVDGGKPAKVRKAANG